MRELGILDNLGLKYNTDKASKYKRRDNIVPGHDYLRHYEIFLSTLRDEKFTLVELGCYTGASLKMWKEYFPQAHIIGVDLNEKLSSLEQDRISLYAPMLLQTLCLLKLLNIMKKFFVL